MDDSGIGGTIIFLPLPFGMQEVQNFSRASAKKVSRKQSGMFAAVAYLVKPCFKPGGGAVPRCFRWLTGSPYGKGEDADSYEVPSKRYFGIEGDPPTLCGE